MSTEERLSERIHRYQSRDSARSVDINGIVLEVQEIERELDRTKAEIVRLRQTSGGIVWLHCNTYYAVGAKMPSGTKWTQSLTKCDHSDISSSPASWFWMCLNASSRERGPTLPRPW